MCLCKQENWYILCRQLTYDTEKEVAEQEQWKASLFPKGAIHTAKGGGASDTRVRSHEHLSGRMGSKAAELASPTSCLQE